MNNQLSPVALAVLEAACEGNAEGDIMGAVAAALRAAANSCEPDWVALTAIHHLHAIADELEALDD